MRRYYRRHRSDRGVYSTVHSVSRAMTSGRSPGFPCRGLDRRLVQAGKDVVGEHQRGAARPVQLLLLDLLHEAPALEVLQPLHLLHELDVLTMFF